jgi:glycosyltransferase involved in cell wall biosynthesis
LQVVMVGGDSVSYGSPPPAPHKTHRERMFAECGVPDPTRVHFLGQLPYASFLDLLQVSSVHLYLTYPFVLSWSLLEALASGCAVLASDTAPVTEFVKHEDNGLLFPFFDQDAMVAGVQQLLSQDTTAMRQRAKDSVSQTLDFNTCILPRLRSALQIC